jgi:hypothetical protein
MLVQSCTVASCYNNCCTDGSTVPEIMGTHSYVLNAVTHLISLYSNGTYMMEDDTVADDEWEGCYIASLKLDIFSLEFWWVGREFLMTRHSITGSLLY